MAKLIMTKGLPAAGKSQWAKEQVVRGKGLIKAITKDDLRKLLDDGAFSKSREKFVESAQATLIKLALDSGYTVIAADTNLAPRQEARLRDIAREKGAAFEVKDFTHVPLEECLRRDQNRPNYVGEQVIRRMWRDHLAPKPGERLIYGDRPRAYIVDIDGTLADLNGRNPYDASTCESDNCRDEVRDVLCGLKLFNSRIQIVLMSGREQKYEEQTRRWLAIHGVPFDHLHMREADDNRKDSIVKRELFDRHVRDVYNIAAVIDDRPQVIRMWRDELGLPVFDVGAGVEF